MGQEFGVDDCGPSASSTRLPNAVTPAVAQLSSTNFKGGAIGPWSAWLGLRRATHRRHAGTGGGPVRRGIRARRIAMPRWRVPGGPPARALPGGQRRLSGVEGGATFSLAVREACGANWMSGAANAGLAGTR